MIATYDPQNITHNEIAERLIQRIEADGRCRIRTSEEWDATEISLAFRRAGRWEHGATLRISDTTGGVTMLDASRNPGWIQAQVRQAVAS